MTAMSNRQPSGRFLVREFPLGPVIGSVARIGWRQWVAYCARELCPGPLGVCDSKDAAAEDCVRHWRTHS